MLITLQQHLSPEQQHELQEVVRNATNILSQPLDHAFTDHTIAHKRRIHDHLDILLCDWAVREISQEPRRARAEIFILLCAVYLHDIGMQFIHFEHCPSLLDAFRETGLPQTPTKEVLEFTRKHHHLITYDWLTQVNLPTGRDIFPQVGLRTHVELVARVAKAHNIWLTNRHSYEGYEELLAIAQEPEGAIRPAILAAFLRLGDLLDLDKRRIDIDKLLRFEIGDRSKAHWWRHHFTHTARLGGSVTSSGYRPLHVKFSIPESHRDDQAWLKPALYSATVEYVEAEQNRLAKWLVTAGIWIDLPSIEDCEIQYDITGKIRPMPNDIAEVFQDEWGRIRIHKKVGGDKLLEGLEKWGGSLDEKFRKTQVWFDGLMADIATNFSFQQLFEWYQDNSVELFEESPKFFHIIKQTLRERIKPWRDYPSMEPYELLLAALLYAGERPFNAQELVAISSTTQYVSKTAATEVLRIIWTKSIGEMNEWTAPSFIGDQVLGIPWAVTNLAHDVFVHDLALADTSLVQTFWATTNEELSGQIDSSLQNVRLSISDSSNALAVLDDATGLYPLPWLSDDILGI